MSLKCLLGSCIMLIQSFLCIWPIQAQIVFVTFSTSVYIMCVCLFSALSRRVGALKISIIIIISKTQCGCWNVMNLFLIVRDLVLRHI